MTVMVTRSHYRGHHDRIRSFRHWIRISAHVVRTASLKGLPYEGLGPTTAGEAMRFTRCLIAATASIASSTVLYAGPAAAGPSSTGASVDDSRLSGPGVGISVTIPAGWHQISDQSQPQLLQIIYPQTCSEPATCATALAGVFSKQAPSAQTAAETVEQTITKQPGMQGATITNKGPIQVAGRTGYHVRFTYSTATAQCQAETVAVETGPVSSGMVPTSIIVVTVSDQAGAPPAGVIDQIIGSAQLTT